jgi:hypothetical protein
MGLETVEIILDMEDYFHIRIPDDEAGTCNTLGDLRQAIHRILVAQGKPATDDLDREIWSGVLVSLKKLGYRVKTFTPNSTLVGDVTENG